MSKSNREPRKPKFPIQPDVARNALFHRARVAAIGVTAALLVLGGAWIVRTPAAAQSETTTVGGQTAAPADPPGTIDGAKNPELIPDEVALRMIVLAVAEPADATEAQKERALAKLRPIGLSEEDTIAFLGLLGDFHTQAKALDEQTAQIRVRAPIPHRDSTDYEQLVNLASQKKVSLESLEVSGGPVHFTRPPVEPTLPSDLGPLSASTDPGNP